MPTNLVYNLDAATGTLLPPGWSLARNSEAWYRKTSTSWAKAASNTIRIEDLSIVAGAASTRKAYLIEPAATNLAPAHFFGGAVWTGESGVFAHNSEQRGSMIERPIRRTDGLGTGDLPALTATDSGSSPSAVTLWALFETVSAERIAVGSRDDTLGWLELLEVVTSNGSVATSIGGDNSVRTVENLGSGPNGGTLYRLSSRGPRQGDKPAVAPIGLYANHLGAIVHHVQYEENPGVTAPVAVGAPRGEDALISSPETAPVPWTLQLLAVSAPWTGRDQVLWQLDDGTESNRLRLVRTSYGSLALQQFVSGVGVLDQQLLASFNERASLGIALDLSGSLLLRWSINGAAAQSVQLTTYGPYTKERLGSASTSGRAWGGWVALASRWLEAGTDITTLSTDSLSLTGTSSVIIPELAVPERYT